MKNRDKLKKLSSTDLAYFLCVDNDGEIRSCCTICQRSKNNNCDDNCISGVNEWLESEEE